MSNQIQGPVPAERRARSAQRWFRGNLHMHSLWSDGFIFPELAAERFKTAGYHFIAFTEHNCFQEGEKWISTDADTFTGKLLAESGFLAAYHAKRVASQAKLVPRPAGRDGRNCVRLKPLKEYRALFEEPERFLIMNGEEVTLSSVSHSLNSPREALGKRSGTHWVNVINAPAPIGELREDALPPEALNRLAARAQRMERESKRPILVSLNHPNYDWNATAEDISAATAIHCFEIHTALNCTRPYGDNEHPGAERLWDIALAQRLSGSDRRVVYGIATDDCHAYYENCDLPNHQRGASMPCRAWVMVRAGQLTPESLISAIRSGDFYASTGVTLESLAVRNARQACSATEIRLQIEEKPGIRYVTRFIGTRRGADLRGMASAADDLSSAAHDRITRKYSSAIGEVLAEVSGAEACYTFRGDELYARALVLSNAPHPNPTIPGDVMKAWTQPVVP